MNCIESSHQKTAAIFGAGVSGLAVRKLALSCGFDAVLFDEKAAGDSTSFTVEDVALFDLFIFSPGFRMDHPWRCLAEASGKPCFGELGFAASLWSGKVIVVTGTNGKTSLTSLLVDALNRAGQNAHAAGNIGRPFSELVLEVESGSAYAVCEVSSFQAELPRGLQLDGLVWTNFSEDHLDRYPSMEMYFNAKANLVKCLKDDAPFVVGRGLLEACPDLLNLHESVLEPPTHSLPIAPGSPFSRFPQSENLATAYGLLEALHIDSIYLADAANAFELAPHRLAKIAESGGITFWDDSKATNFHAAIAAVAAVPGPVFWIGGGQSKRGDLAAFAQAMAPHVEAAFLYGEVAEEFAEKLSAWHSQVSVAAYFSDAVSMAVEAARLQAPATVLLSPGFASFDQFSSYAERGKTFLSLVLSLMHSSCAK